MFHISLYFRLTEAGLPVNLLPYVVCAGHKAGVLQHDLLSIKAGTHILAALGDVQCAVYSVLTTPQDAGNGWVTGILNTPNCCFHFILKNKKNTASVV
jgi:sugar (pentulose or hexulose) kinase